MTPADWDRMVARADMERDLKHARRVDRFQWRLGRRGAFLAMMGLLFMVLGGAYGFMDVPDATLEQLALPLLIIPDLRVWGALWVLSGAIAVFNAWWPPGKDAAGFIALEAFSLIWATLNICGSLFLDAPRAWVVGIIFAVYAVAVSIVSGMPDPTPLVKSREENGSER